MKKDPKELLKELRAGVQRFEQLHGDCMPAFHSLGKSVMKPGTLDTKTKELIAAAVGLAVRCDYCIVAHVHGALSAGATREELVETAGVACFMGGGPVVTYSSTLFQDSIESFAPEFEKK
jgi:AhpD family alkylhydroperoxidase